MRQSEKRSDLCTSVARKTLQSFSGQRDQLKPPLPIEEIAAWLGFQVVRLSNVEDACSALVSTRDRLIGINGRHHRHRQRFSLGHELAHILLKHPPEARCTRNEIVLYNAEADECAAQILMPEDLLTRWLGVTRSIRELARVFDVSKEAMARKLARMEMSSFHEWIRTIH
jgi:Zn-dependent peptidase ImmA (M78 family)